MTKELLRVNHVNIKRVHSYKFLGVLISSNLSWFEHIQYISKKVSKNLGLIYRLKFKFPKYILQTLYNSLILPYFTYCISIWGFSPKTHLYTLNLNQNIFLRIFYNLKKFEHISIYYNLLNILKIKQLFTLYSLTFLYKLLKLNFCPILNTYLSQFQNHRFKSLRKNPDFYLMKPRTNFYINSTIPVAMRLWNTLPINVKESSNLSNFKKSVCQLISSNHFFSIVDT